MNSTQSGAAESSIVYEEGEYYCTLSRTGRSRSYMVWRNHGSHAVLCSTIGESFGLERVKAEIRLRLAA